ncbi:hypothetical protein CH370_06795 [Leptospira kmetyi]|nr:hypothetical protein CH370_06795 [Leptospira kmetyi]
MRIPIRGRFRSSTGKPVTKSAYKERQEYGAYAFAPVIGYTIVPFRPNSKERVFYLRLSSRIGSMTVHFKTNSKKNFQKVECSLRRLYSVFLYLYK